MNKGFLPDLLLPKQSHGLRPLRCEERGASVRKMAIPEVRARRNRTRRLILVKQPIRSHMDYLSFFSYKSTLCVVSEYAVPWNKRRDRVRADEMEAFVSIMRIRFSSMCSQRSLLV
jgi:hypothetical protein